MRRTMRSLAYLALGASLVCACSQSQERTRIAVTVYSDLSIPDVMDAIRIDVQGATDSRRLDFALSTTPTAGRYQLPVRLVLVPLAGKDDAFTVTATAVLGTTDILSRTARLSFLPGEARELVLFLGSNCKGVSCPADKTCVNGACVPPDIDVSTLPPYTTNQAGPPPDASPPATEAGVDGVGSPIDVGNDGAPRSADVLPDAEVRSEAGTGAAVDVQPGLPDASPRLDLQPGTDVVDAPLPPRPDGSNDAPVAEVLSPGPDVAPPSDLTPVRRDVAAADAPVSQDAACPAICTLGDKKCGATGGVQTCVVLAGCPNWGQEVACAARMTCAGAAPAAQCACDAGPAACQGSKGTYCDASGLLQSCELDTNGCVYAAAPTTCPATKPCTGSFPSASCSCAAPVAPCTAGAGSYCASATQVTVCALDGNGCMVASPGKTCPAGKPCSGAGNADCTCPSVPACDGALANTAYCRADNTVVTCSADANGCQQAALESCTEGKPCSTAGGADCRCLDAPAACLAAGGEPTAGTACSGGSLVTCGTSSEGCMVITNTASCPTTKTCQGTIPNAACACPTAIPAGCESGAGAECIGDSTLRTCTGDHTTTCYSATVTDCNAGNYCVGTFPDATCAPPTAYGAYDDLGASGTRNSVVLLGHPVSITAPSTLRKFGVIMRAAANVKMGLYREDSSTSGTLVASIPASAAAIGRNEYAVTPVALAAGTYWIMAIFSVDAASVAQSIAPTSARRTVSGSSYLNPLPTTITASSSTGSQSNYYILVTPQ